MSHSLTGRRAVRITSTSMLTLLVWLGRVTAAEAQLCRGGPSFSGLPYQASAIAELGDDTRGIGGDFFVGGRYLFGGAGVVVRDIETAGSTATEVSSRVGVDLLVSRMQRIYLCPSALVSFGTGPDIGDLDVSTFRIGAGLRAGVAVRDTDGLTVVPTFGIDVLRERLAFESGGVEQDESDGIGIASLGVGFIINRRFAIIPELAAPFSAADSEVIFSVRISYGFGT